MGHSQTLCSLGDDAFEATESLQHAYRSRFDMSVFRVLVAIEDLIMTKKMISALAEQNTFTVLSNINILSNIMCLPFLNGLIIECFVVSKFST